MKEVFEMNVKKVERGDGKKKNGVNIKGVIKRELYRQCMQGYHEKS